MIPLLAMRPSELGSGPGAGSRSERNAVIDAHTPHQQGKLVDVAGYGLRVAELGDVFCVGLQCSVSGILCLGEAAGRGPPVGARREVFGCSRFRGRVRISNFKFRVSLCEVRVSGLVDVLDPLVVCRAVCHIGRQCQCRFCSRRRRAQRKIDADGRQRGRVSGQRRSARRRSAGSCPPADDWHPGSPFPHPSPRSRPRMTSRLFA